MVKTLIWGEHPWNDIAASSIDNWGTPRAMMRMPEKKYLYWMMKELYEGLGAVLDLGPLTGGSTVCLTGGLLDNQSIPSNKKPKIESYDLFYYDATWGKLSHRGIYKDDNFLERFRKNTDKIKDQVTTIVGDILDVKTYEKPIEILFVDLAKSEKLMCHIMKTFYPKLIVGSGVIIHQDYKFLGMPYLKIFQQVFSEYFEILPYPDDVQTVSFRLVKSLPDDFEETVDSLTALSNAERVKYLKGVP